MRTRVVVRAGGVSAVVLLAAAAPAGAAPEEGGAEGKELSHEAEECIHILEDGGTVERCHQAPNPILPETNEILYGGLSFLVLFLLMWKFAFPAVGRAMEARTQRIRDSLDEAERTKAEAERVLDDYKRQLADAKSEAARIIEEARQTAEQLRADLMARAEAEVADLRQRAQDDIAAARDRALADLRTQVAELAVGAAEVVVQHNLDREANRALVERFIEQVGAGR